MTLSPSFAVTGSASVSSLPVNVPRVSPSGACPRIHLPDTLPSTRPPLVCPQPQKCAEAQASSLTASFLSVSKSCPASLSEFSCLWPPKDRGCHGPRGPGLRHVDMLLSRQGFASWAGDPTAAWGPTLPYALKPPSWNSSSVLNLGPPTFLWLWVPQLAWPSLRTWKRTHGPPSCPVSRVLCAHPWRPSPLDPRSLIKGTPFWKLPWLPGPCWHRLVDLGVLATALSGVKIRLQQVSPRLGSTLQGLADQHLRPPAAPPRWPRSLSGPRHQLLCPPSSGVLRSDLLEK